MTTFTPPLADAIPETSSVRRGRLDDLVLAIADRVCTQSGNPMVSAMYQEYRPLVEEVVREHLSPDVLKKKRKTSRKSPRRRKSQ